MKRLINVIKRLVCSYCGCDINATGQDNMSSTLGRPMCNNCYNSGR